jgi:glycosyltransferase involved in cell wall biosynthesis
VLIPNQEWFHLKWRKHLPQFDRVICKTLHAQEIFAKLSCPTSFSSFTSRDRRIRSGAPKTREFLLMVGNRRGITDRVLGLWARRPEWPRLIVSGRHIPPGIDLPNAVLMRDFVPEEEIIRLQNTCRFHICVTAAEGVGHKYAEALSCGAVVLATDGPPMNEIIQPDRGLLVKWERTNPKFLGTEFHFDEADLERTIERCLQLSEAEIATISANGRDWYEKNDRFFRSELPRILRDVIGSAA